MISAIANWFKNVFFSPPAHRWWRQCGQNVFVMTSNVSVLFLVTIIHILSRGRVGLFFVAIVHWQLFSGHIPWWVGAAHRSITLIRSWILSPPNPRSPPSPTPPLTYSPSDHTHTHTIVTQPYIAPKPPLTYSLNLIQHLCQNTTFHYGQTSGATVSDILESSHICHTHTLSHKCSHNCDTRTTPVTLPRYSPGVSQQWSFNESSLSIFNSTVHFQLRIVTNQYHMAVSQILATIWDEIFKYNLLKNMFLAP